MRLTIGVLAKRAGVGVQTVRYYQRRKLLPVPPRRGGRSIRVYTDETLTLLRFIRRAQGLGFTLKEIEELLELRRHPQGSCESVKRAFQAKLADLAARIRIIEFMRAEVLRFLGSCEHTGDGPCNVLEALYEDDDLPFDEGGHSQPVDRRPKVVARPSTTQRK